MDNSTRDYLDSPQIAAKYGMIIISISVRKET